LAAFVAGQVKPSARVLFAVLVLFTTLALYLVSLALLSPNPPLRQAAGGKAAAIVCNIGAALALTFARTRAFSDLELIARQTAPAAVQTSMFYGLMLIGCTVSILTIKCGQAVWRCRRVAWWAQFSCTCWCTTRICFAANIYGIFKYILFETKKR
jgi:hypothetical protein